MTLELVPRDDIVAHEDGDVCACLPTTVPVEGGFLVVHQAWDGRK